MFRPKNKKTISRKSWLLRKLLGLFIVLGLVGTAGYFLINSGGFTLREVVINGNRNLTESQLMILMRIHGGENLVLLPIERIYERLHTSPWIREVSLRKELPARLIVRIRESEPEALLMTREGMVIVDGEGIELEKIKEEAEHFLPVIYYSGSPGSVELKEALMLATVINDAGITKQAGRVEILGLDRGIKDMIVRIDGMQVKVGKGSYKQKLNRLYELISDIRGRDIDVDYIDLRFANRVVVKPVAEVLQ
ncbi:cell division protein FtsQ/DivIB [Nitrospirota bacterium]